MVAGSVSIGDLSRASGESGRDCAKAAFDVKESQPLTLSQGIMLAWERGRWYNRS
jgi:hypothetical protein